MLMLTSNAACGTQNAHTKPERLMQLSLSPTKEYTMIKLLTIITATLALTIALTIASVSANAQSYCNPERSKPCGNGCISLVKTCRTSWTTSKIGINPNKAGKKGYETPKFVEKVPTN